MSPFQLLPATDMSFELNRAMSPNQTKKNHDHLIQSLQLSEARSVKAPHTMAVEQNRILDPEFPETQSFKQLMKPPETEKQHSRKGSSFISSLR